MLLFALFLGSAQTFFRAVLSIKTHGRRRGCPGACIHDHSLLPTHARRNCVIELEQNDNCDAEPDAENAQRGTGGRGAAGLKILLNRGAEARVKEGDSEQRKAENDERCVAVRGVEGPDVHEQDFDDADKE